MGIFGFIGWIINSVIDFVFEMVTHIFVWIMPSYMTVQVIKDEKKTVAYSKNYMCFWIILAVLWALEYTILYFFCSMTLYRVVRLALVVWLQIDYCGNAATAFTLVKPLISKDHEEKLAGILESVTSEIDKHGGKIKESVQSKFWGVVHQNYELIKDAVFSAMASASEKAGKMTSPKKADAGEERSGAEKEAVQKKES